MLPDDANHISGQLTPNQIGEAIRRKKYGRDMREAIAQGFEQFIGILQRMSDLESKYSDLQSKYSDLLSKYNDIIDRLNDDENKIRGLRGDIEALSKKHNDDIEAINQRLTKLEDAVFGLATADITTPPTPDYPNSGMVEVNFDDRKDKKDKW